MEKPAGNSTQFERVSTKPKLSILSVGLAAFFSSLLIYAGTVTAFLRYEGVFELMNIFAWTTLFTLLGASVVILISQVLGFRIPTKILMGAGSILHLLGCIAFAYLVLSPQHVTHVAYAGAIICGIGEAFLALTWGRIFARFKLRDALLNVAVASLGGSVVYGIIVASQPLIGVGVFVAAAILAAVVPLLVGGTMGEVRKHTRKDDSLAEAISSFKSFANVIEEPAIGLFVFAFFMGLTCYFFFEIFWVYIAAMVASSCLLAVIVFLPLKVPLTRFLYRSFIPILAVIVLAISNITQVLFADSLLDMFFMLLLYTFAAVLTLATLCAIANASEFSSDTIFSTALVLFAVASLAGLVCANLLANEVVLVIMTIITTLYILFIFVSRSTRAGRNEGELEVSESEPGAISVSCMELAETHALTAREYEVLVYLAQGYGNGYISEALFISPNTVRTHVHNLYRKLGVKSREQIIDLTR